MAKSKASEIWGDEVGGVNRDKKTSKTPGTIAEVRKIITDKLDDMIECANGDKEAKGRMMYFPVAGGFGIEPSYGIEKIKLTNKGPAGPFTKEALPGALEKLMEFIQAGNLDEEIQMAWDKVLKSASDRKPKTAFTKYSKDKDLIPNFDYDKKGDKIEQKSRKSNNTKALDKWKKSKEYENALKEFLENVYKK